MNTPQDRRRPLAALVATGLWFTLLVAAAGFAVRVLAVSLSGQHLDVSAAELARLYMLGLRFDLKFAGTVLAGVWALALLWLAWPRAFAAYAWAGLVVLAVVVFAVWWLAMTDLGFVFYFGHPIDIMVFELFHDDAGAITRTALRDWRVYLELLATAVATGLFVWLARRPWASAWLQARLPRHPAPQALALLTLALLSGLAARGSLGTFPLARKTGAVSHQPFLNALAMNGPLNLYYADKDRREAALPESSAKVLQAAGFADVEALARAAGFAQPGDVIVTSAAAVSRPVHVVFFLMEGWSTHIAMGDEPGRNDVLAGFRKHGDAAGQGGAADHWYPRDFSAGYGTNPSIEQLLLQSPVTPVAQSRARRVAFRTAMPRIFRNAGYATVFVSGGAATWQNHADFWPRQGFDAYEDRSVIERRYGVSSPNPWGIPDEYVFDYVWERLSAADAGVKPLFAFVLSTTNHDPVILPEHYRPGPVDPTVYGLRDDTHKRGQLQGYQYAMAQLGRFLDRLKASPMADHTVVVATGDHVRRNFADYADNRDGFWRFAVPAYIYAPASLTGAQHLPATAAVVGSHLDLLPTALDLAVPGARFPQFGQSLARPASRRWGAVLSHGADLFETGVARLVQNEWRFFPFAAPGSWQVQGKDIVPPPEIAAAIVRIAANRTLQSWLVVRQVEDPGYDPLRP